MNSIGVPGHARYSKRTAIREGEIETSRLYEWGAGMRISSFWSTRVLSLYHLSIKRIPQSCTCITSHTHMCMRIRVARGCGVAYGLRRTHICSNVMVHVNAYICVPPQPCGILRFSGGGTSHFIWRSAQNAPRSLCLSLTASKGFYDLIQMIYIDEDETVLGMPSAKAVRVISSRRGLQR